MGKKFVIAICVGAALAVAAVPALVSSDDAQSNDTSFYVREIQGERASDRMQPTLISPVASEAKHPNCPPSLRMRCSDGHADLLSPYWSAIGAFDAGEAFDPFERVWHDLGKRIREDEPGRPVRVLIKHYPRAKAPGRCVTIHVTFYTVPDPRFDDDRPGPDGSMPGAFFEVRQTWQLEGPEPALIEASMEVTTNVRAIGHRRGFVDLAKPEGAPAGWGQDPAMGAHFFGFGGGKRYGLVWFDRSAGRGDVDGWAKAYTVVDDKATVQHDLGDAQTEKLRGIVSRF